MRIVFTGGGTGGHILPNIAIIEALVQGTDALDILYIGTTNPTEQQLVEREMKRITREHVGEQNFTWRYTGISAGKLRRYIALQNFLDIGKVVQGLWQSLKLLRKFRPQLVFSKGGYVTAPVVAAARLLKLPVWIHESDVSPGLSTKLNARSAQRIFLSFEESRKFFTTRADLLHKKIDVVGNPIRAAVTKGSVYRARGFLNLHSQLPVLLVMGGSLGSQFINTLLEKTINVLLNQYIVIHSTGPNNPPLLDHPHYYAFPFLDAELADCYALADGIISRSGAGSVFECAAVNKPTIFIPLSRAASRGDQIENAEAAQEHMSAVVLTQEQLTEHPELLITEMAKLRAHHSDTHKKPLALDGAQRISDAMRAQKLPTVEL